jgi:hypothetical protein
MRSILPASDLERWEAVREGGGGAAAASGEAPGASAGPVVAAGDGSLGCSEVAGRLLPGASGGAGGDRGLIRWLSWDRGRRGRGGAGGHAALPIGASQLSTFDCGCGVAMATDGI